MSISLPLRQYLSAKNVAYDVIAHRCTASSMRTAKASQIPGECLAKGVVLRTEHELHGDCFCQPSHSSYILAVLPASHRINLQELRTQLGFDVVLANEHEVEDLFEDCSPGAIPPIGECYGLDVVVDESVVDQPEVYLEAGDHETLVHLRRDQFARLMETARRERFSTYYCNEKSAVKVERVMHKAVTWVSPDTPIVHVAELMREHDIGAIPVGQNDQLVGMVTDRDIVCRGLAEKNFDTRRATVRDVMTLGIHCCREDDDLAKAVRHMKQLKLRRLPVINSRKRMVGMLSLGDLAHSAPSHLVSECVKSITAHH